MKPLAAIAIAAAALLLIGGRNVKQTQQQTTGEIDAELLAAIRARALRDVGAVREEGGPNRGPIVNQYLAAVREAPGANWCTAAVAAWIRDACAELGRPVPPLVSGAKLQGELLRQEGWRFVPAANMNEVTAPGGSIVIMDRSQADDPTTPQNEHAATKWQGHIGALDEWLVPVDTFGCIEGNSGPTTDRVALMTRDRRNPKVLGALVPLRKAAA